MSFEWSTILGTEFDSDTSRLMIYVIKTSH